jgi:hypothetical protein
MHNMMTGFAPQGPSYETPGDSGGSGGGAPQGGGSPAAGQPSAPVAEPSVIDLSDDALIRVKGAKEPVKFGEHVRGFQSQWTKAAQKAAALEKKLQEREAEIQRFRTEQQRAQQMQQQGGQRGGQPDVFESLQQLPYLTGKDAVEVVRSIGQQIEQRDQILLGTLKQLQSMQKLVSQLQETHTTNSFESKITKLLSENGYSNEYSDIAKEIYLAYEGDDLDVEFPGIFESRINQLRKAFEAERQAKLREARPRPFLPGRGGDGRPSKPLDIKPDASSKEVADQLWPLFQGNET